MTERDYELLSTYLDGLLDADERAALEARLLTDNELRRELAALRQTVNLLHTLPTLKAPRDFRLTAEQSGIREITRSRRAASRFTPFLPLLAGVAGIGVMFIGVLALLSLLGPTVGNVFSEVAYSVDEDRGRQIPMTPSSVLIPPPPAAQGGGVGGAAEADEEALADDEMSDADAAEAAVEGDEEPSDTAFRQFETVPSDDDAATIIPQTALATEDSGTVPLSTLSALTAPESAAALPEDQPTLPFDLAELAPLLVALRLLLGFIARG